MTDKKERKLWNQTTTNPLGTNRQDRTMAVDRPRAGHEMVPRTIPTTPGTSQRVRTARTAVADEAYLAAKPYVHRNAARRTLSASRTSTLQLSCQRALTSAARTLSMTRLA